MRNTQFFAVDYLAGSNIPFANLTVVRAGTTKRVPLYDGEGNDIGNPMTATSVGLFSFFVADGVYDLYISGPDYSAPPILAYPIFDVARMNGIVNNLETQFTTGRKGFATWAALAAFSPAPAPNTIAEVVGPDYGTHTDAALTTVVPNQGIYAYSTALTAWTRIGGEPVLPTFPAIQRNVSANVFLLTSLESWGSTPVGSALIRFRPGTARPAGLGIAIAIPQINGDGDIRQLRIPPGAIGDQVPDGAWTATDEIVIQWDAGFYLLRKVIPIAGATAVDPDAARTGYQTILHRREVDSAADAKTAALEI